MLTIFYVFSLMMKVDLSKRLHLIKNINGNVLFSIGSFIYYKTQAEMCYKWIQLIHFLPPGGAIPVAGRDTRLFQL